MLSVQLLFSTTMFENSHAVAYIMYTETFIICCTFIHFKNIYFLKVKKKMAALTCIWKMVTKKDVSSLLRDCTLQLQKSGNTFVWEVRVESTPKDSGMHSKVVVKFFWEWISTLKQSYPPKSRFLFLYTFKEEDWSLYVFNNFFVCTFLPTFALYSLWYDLSTRNRVFSSYVAFICSCFAICIDGSILDCVLFIDRFK